MNTFFIIFFFVFGLIIGSFLNVVIYRYNTGRGLWGRSKCFSCRRSLGPIDLVPVLSFLAFRGRCRTCKSKISWQYPAVELVLGLLFALSAYVSLPLADLYPIEFMAHLGFMLIILSVLMLIVVYDMRHKIIPDPFVFVFSGLAFLNLFFVFDASGGLGIAMPPMINIAAGLILAFPFYLLWLISSGTWMGLGDAKLALGIGWLLGLGAGGTAIIFGFWIGAAVSIVLIALSAALRRAGGRKLFGRFRLPRLSMRSEIPFAPFLVAGLLIVLFYGYNMFSAFQALI